jgi:hypothetical protein
MHLALSTSRGTPSAIAPRDRRGDNRTDGWALPAFAAGLPCLAVARAANPMKGIKTPALLRSAGRLLTLI